jgi:hypothetical protein
MEVQHSAGNQESALSHFCAKVEIEHDNMSKGLGQRALLNCHICWTFSVALFW